MFIFKWRFPCLCYLSSLSFFSEGGRTGYIEPNSRIFSFFFWLCGKEVVFWGWHFRGSRTFHIRLLIRERVQWKWVFNVRQRWLVSVQSVPISLISIVSITSQWTATNAFGYQYNITLWKHSAISQKWHATTWYSFWFYFARYASFMVRKGNARRSRSPCVRTLATI